MLPQSIEERIVLTPKDIAELYRVSRTTVGRIFRSIKNVSDITGCSRIVHVRDYELWLKSREGKGRTHCTKTAI